MNRDARNEVLTWIIAIFTTIGTLLVGYPIYKEYLQATALISNTALGIIALALSVVLFFTRRRSALPNLSIMEIRKTVHIHDTKGARGSITRVQKEIVNRPISSRTFSMNGLVADGTIDNLKINGAPVQPHETQVNLGTIHVLKTWTEL